MNFIIDVVYMVFGMWIGYTIMDMLFKKPRDKTVSSEDFLADIAETSGLIGSPMFMQLSTTDDYIYAHGDDGAFLCHGKTMAVIEEKFHERFPDSYAVLSDEASHEIAQVSFAELNPETHDLNELLENMQKFRDGKITQDELVESSKSLDKFKGE